LLESITVKDKALAEQDCIRVGRKLAESLGFKNLLRYNFVGAADHDDRARRVPQFRRMTYCDNMLTVKDRFDSFVHDRDSWQTETEIRLYFKPH
jgi:hypothetical protein